MTAVVREDSSLLELTAANQLLWNGVEIDFDTLRSLLQEVRASPTEPELAFFPDAASDFVEAGRVLRVLNESGLTNIGLVGNEKFRATGPQED